MTIKDFYEWAITNEVENAEIHILNRDGGGYYGGYEELMEQEIYIEDSGKVVEI